MSSTAVWRGPLNRTTRLSAMTILLSIDGMDHPLRQMAAREAKDDETTALTSFHAGGSAGTPQQVATGGNGGAAGTTPMCALAARVGPRLVRRQVSAHVRPRTSPTAVAAARPGTYYCRRGTGRTRMLRRRDDPRRPPT